MFTAASNSTGWVIFLSQILERWMGCKIYDEIIFQEMIVEWHLFNKSNCYNDIGYIKNMNMIHEIMDYKYKHETCNFKVIAIDDRPENIVNGISIGVKPYNVAINIFALLQIFLPEQFEYLMQKYNNIINGSWEKYLKCPYIYSSAFTDREIFDKIEHIEKLINTVH
jgi:hypothetical protein